MKALAIVLCCMSLGCAHTCLTPEERAAKYGTVLECKPPNQTLQRNGGRAESRCLISTPGGDTYHYFKVCE